MISLQTHHSAAACSLAPWWPHVWVVASRCGHTFPCGRRCPQDAGLGQGAATLYANYAERWRNRHVSYGGRRRVSRGEALTVAVQIKQRHLFVCVSRTLVAAVAAAAADPTLPGGTGMRDDIICVHSLWEERRGGFVAAGQRRCLDQVGSASHLFTCPPKMYYTGDTLLYTGGVPLARLENCRNYGN